MASETEPVTTLVVVLVMVPPSGPGIVTMTVTIVVEGAPPGRVVLWVVVMVVASVGAGVAEALGIPDSAVS